MRRKAIIIMLQKRDQKTSNHSRQTILNTPSLRCQSLSLNSKTSILFCRSCPLKRPMKSKCHCFLLPNQEHQATPLLHDGIEDPAALPWKSLFMDGPATSEAASRLSRRALHTPDTSPLVNPATTCHPTCHACSHPVSVCPFRWDLQCACHRPLPTHRCPCPARTLAIRVSPSLAPEPSVESEQNLKTHTYTPRPRPNRPLNYQPDADDPAA